MTSQSCVAVGHRHSYCHSPWALEQGAAGMHLPEAPLVCSQLVEGPDLAQGSCQFRALHETR